MQYTNPLLILSALLPVALTLPHSNPPTCLSPLNWDVYLADASPVANSNKTFSQTAFTLIHGAHSAILVDAPVNINHSNYLADWITATIPNKTLTHIYITHGHGDHFFGIPVLQERFPGLEVLATHDVIEHAKEQMSGDSFDDFWEPLFPGGQIPPQTEVWNALPSNGEFQLEGHVLRAVEVGQTDTYNSTVLHVPDLDLVVAGDVVYGEYYQYFVESNTPELRAQWLQALYKVDALEPKWVVPSHKQAWDGFGRNHIETTRNYITFWAQEIEEVGNKTALLSRLGNVFPERKGDFILDISAETAFPSS